MRFRRTASSWRAFSNCATRSGASRATTMDSNKTTRRSWDPVPSQAEQNEGRADPLPLCSTSQNDTSSCSAVGLDRPRGSSGDDKLRALRTSSPGSPAWSSWPPRRSPRCLSHAASSRAAWPTPSQTWAAPEGTEDPTGNARRGRRRCGPSTRSTTTPRHRRARTGAVNRTELRLRCGGVVVVGADALTCGTRRRPPSTYVLTYQITLPHSRGGNEGRLARSSSRGLVLRAASASDASPRLSGDRRESVSLRDGEVRFTTSPRGARSEMAHEVGVARLDRWCRGCGAPAREVGRPAPEPRRGVRPRRDARPAPTPRLRACSVPRAQPRRTSRAPWARVFNVCWSSRSTRRAPPVVFGF